MGAVAGLRRQNVIRNSVAISSPEEDFLPRRDRKWPKEGVTQRQLLLTNASSWASQHADGGW